MSILLTELSGSEASWTIQSLTGSGTTNYFKDSNIFGDSSSDTHQFSGSVFVSGTLRANEYRVQTIDTYAGSTFFGNSSGDVHTFTGDVSGSTRGIFVTSLTTAGPLSVSGSSTLAGAISVTGDVSVAGDVSSSARGIFTTSLTTAGALNVSGSAALAGGAIVTGDVSGSARGIFVGDIITAGTVFASGSSPAIVAAGHVSGSGLGTFVGGVATEGSLKVSGSTVFGNASGDTHQFTGSVTTLGLLSAFGVGNPSTISTSLTIPANYNFVMQGPITVANGVSLTVDSSSNLKIKDISEA